MTSDPKQKPSALADVLQTALERLGGARFDAVRSVQKNWIAVVGEVMANKTRVVGVKDGALAIETDGAVWSQELTLQKNYILAKLRELAPKAGVRELRVRTVGTIS
jgi:predicted nucleic acid-binding Zn ribbon protein